MGENTVEFTEVNFKQDVLEANKPVLVDFWAQWCGPCRMLTSIIDELANEYIDKASVGKVNVDQYPEIATKYGIRSIPCLLFFKNGEVKKQIMGSVPKNEIATVLDDLSK